MNFTARLLLAFLFFIFTTSAAAAKKSRRGELLISTAENFLQKKVVTDYALKDKTTGKVTKLKLKKQDQLKVAPGAAVVVSGTESNGTLSVETLQIEDAGSAMAVSVQKKIIAIIIHMSGGNNGLSESALESALYGSSGSARDLYRKNSFGGFELISDTNGDGRADILTVQIPSALGTTCDTGTWRQEAMAQAQAKGVDFSLYTTQLYVVASNASCWWNGFASGNITWVRSAYPEYAAYVIAHELGHTFGLGHASTDGNNDGHVDSEYGDASCFMGNEGPELRFLNGPHALKMQFYNGFAGRVREIQQNQTFELAPLEENAASANTAQIVRVPRAGLAGQYLYFSFRNSSSYQANIGGFGNGLSVHAAGVSPYQSLLLRVVSAGETFIDAGSGVKVKVESVSGGKLVASVEVGSATCMPSAPTVTLGGMAIKVPDASGNVSFDVYLKNNDTFACGASAFNFSNSSSAEIIPNDIAAVSVSPGQNAKVNVKLNVGSAAEQNHNVLLSIVGSKLEHNLQMPYVVSVDRTAPSAPSSLVFASGKRGSGQLSWTGSSDALSGVAYYEIFVDGVLVNTSSETWSALYSRGSLYTVRAVDYAGNRSLFGSLTGTTTTSKGRRK